MAGEPPVVTRFAPSPTGHLHVGGARTALFCWALARRRGGHFLLRIEDTDRARSSEGAARGIMEDLAWLGIEWDEGPRLEVGGGSVAARALGGDPRGVGPFFQAQRVHLYDAHVIALVERGRAYPAFETPGALERKRKEAVAAKRTYRYDRAALAEVADVRDRLRRMESGEPHVVRFLAPPEEVVVHDEVLGDVRYGAGEMDDFVIRKADGFPTYHFAVVVDDELMGVTDVLRAQEHLNNTPRHVALQRALVRADTGAGFRVPRYAHVPLIFNPDGTKMSKRDKAKAGREALRARLDREPATSLPALAGALGVAEGDLAAFLAKESDSLEIAEGVSRGLGVPLPEVEVSDFREAGYAPEAIVNFLALLGWNPGMKLPDGKDLEKFDMAFLAEHFSLERVGTTNAKFDRKKLLSFNAAFLGSLSDEEFAVRWSEWLEFTGRGGAGEVEAVGEPVRGRWLARAVKARAKTFRDASDAFWFLWTDPHERPPSGEPGAAAKFLLAENRAGLAMLREFRPGLAAVEPWTPEAIHTAVEAFAREKGHITEKGINIGPVSQAIRVAVAGAGVTPPLGETLAALGKPRTLERIGRCLRKHEG